MASILTSNFVLEAVLPMSVFAGFVILTLFVRPSDTPQTSVRLWMLICYVITASTYAGLQGYLKDLWPFAGWRYVAYSVGNAGAFPRLVGVDASGREHTLDTRAYEPLEFNELIGFLNNIPEARQEELYKFLLQRAQEGVALARAGRPIGTFSRFLGPLSAPTFQVDQTPWKNPENVPRELVELRLYVVFWRVSGNAARTEKLELVRSIRL